MAPQSDKRNGERIKHATRRAWPSCRAWIPASAVPKREGEATAAGRGIEKAESVSEEDRRGQEAHAHVHDTCHVPHEIVRSFLPCLRFAFDPRAGGLMRRQ